MPSPASLPPTTIDRRSGPRKGPPHAAKLKTVKVAALAPPVETTARRRRGRPPRLSRPAIFRAALRLLDTEGAGALTMRRLGAEMGVEAMSLYRHISSKDALLDGIGEQLMGELEEQLTGEIDVDAPDTDWEVTAHQLALGIRGVARAHPAAFTLVGLRTLNTVDAMRPIEVLLGALRDGGFPDDRAVAAFRTLSGYARGFALTEIAGFTLTSGSGGLTGDKLPLEDFPAIHGMAGALARSPNDDDYHSGIETIVAGLRLELAELNGRRRAARKAAATRL